MKSLILSFTKYFIVGLTAWFSPIYYDIVFVCILVGADTITGVMKAGKEDVKNIWSRKMFGFVPKLIFYFVLIISAQACLLYVEPKIPFTKLALIGIAFIEVKSIDENFEELFGYSFLNKVLDGVKSINQIKRHKDDAN